MKRNEKRSNAGNRFGQGGIGMKKLTALVLSLALALGMLGAVAEESDAGLVLGEPAQASDGAIIVGDEAAGDDGMDIELAEDAILDGDALVVDALSMDGLEDNLLSDGLSGLESVAEGDANALAGNESDPEDFEIDGDGMLVKYAGPGGDVVIPDGVTSIGKKAFYDCDSLTSVTIPDGVTSIGEYAFYDCGSLTSVTIPDSVTSIGEYAFYALSSLTSATIGMGVSPDDLFGCELLNNRAIEALDVTENNDVYASEDGVLYAYGMDTLLRCPAAKASVTISDSATNIGRKAFRKCISLTSVTIPDSITSIGEYAFLGCNGLTSVTIPDNVTSIGEYAFLGCDGLKRVTIGMGVGLGDLFHCDLLDSIATEAFEVTEYNDVYASEDGVLYTYDMGTLLRCPIAKASVTISDSATTIGDYAFYQCGQLTSVTIPDGVASLGEGAFCNCYNLVDIYIPASVKTIGSDAFYYYSSPSYDEDEYEYEDWDDSYYAGYNLDLTIHGYLGSYAETYAREEGFRFSPIGGPVSLAEAKVTVPAQVYSGKAKKPAVKVVLDGRTLIKGTDYTVTYKNNKAIGTATAIVKGKGSYTGTVKKTFEINPKAVKGFKVASAQRALLAKWERVAGVTGYQLQYGLKKRFSGAKKVTVAKADTVVRSINGLKKGKTYYVRIRAYKKVGKKMYYSAWSAAKKAKVK